MGFDHVSFTVETREELFELRDMLEGAGIDVRGAVDHGIIWSIYFFDPNNIPLEASWDCMEILAVPAMDEAVPMAIVAEGAEPRPGHWPEPAKRTPVEHMRAWPGNAHTMRETLLAGWAGPRHRGLRGDARGSAQTARAARGEHGRPAVSRGH